MSCITITIAMIAKTLTNIIIIYHEVHLFAQRQSEVVKLLPSSSSKVVIALAEPESQLKILIK